MAQKPPLGVAPKWIRQEQRLEELCGAITRYRREAQPIPNDWLEEIRDLASELLSRPKRDSTKGDVMNVDEMDAGLELDMLIADRVMGLVVFPDPVNKRGVSVGEIGPNGADLKKYSTDITAAWEIVEKVKATSSRGYVLDFIRGEWTVGLRACGDAGEPELYGSDAGRAETAPLAICRAALKAAL